MLATCDDSLAGVRDRALLLFAWGSGGRHRSEVAAARVEDLVSVNGGYLFHLRRSKIDQAGEGVELRVLRPRRPPENEHYSALLCNSAAPTPTESHQGCAPGPP